MTTTTLRKRLSRPFIDHYGYTRHWVVTACFAICIVAGLCAIVFGVMTATRRTCYAQAAQMQVPARWGVWTDCMVQVDGQWVPLDNVRIIPAQEAR